MDRQRLQQHKRRNAVQQLGLLAVLALLLGYLAWVVGGEPFLWGTLIGVGALWLVNPVASPRLVLGMYGARALSPREVPDLYMIVEALAVRAGLERLPRLYYLPSRVMNAFATGRRDDAAVVLSDGLLRRLGRRELIGVLAHELAHVANGDIQVMAFADTMSRITGLLGLFGQVLLGADDDAGPPPAGPLPAPHPPADRGAHRAPFGPRAAPRATAPPFGSAAALR